jgi:WD40 repeat protein
MLEGHDRTVYSVTFSHDDTQVASGLADNTIKIWDAGNGTCLKTLKGHGGSVFLVKFLYNGTQVASGSSDNTVKI